MNTSLSKKLQKTLIVFPAIAMVVSVGCVSASGAKSDVSAAAKKTTTTVKKKSTTTTKAPKGSAGNPTALAVLASIPQAKEQGAGYNRNDYKHWSDLDRNGCSTREDVLIAESRTKPQVDAYGCKVIAGDWYSPYENKAYSYPADVDIDHVVALKEAHDSGAWAWSAAKREQYANDVSDGRSLIAVKDSENQSKSDKDPSNWIPKNKAYLCTYLADWVAIKAHWKLSMDTSEWGRIKNLLTASCKTTTIAPWGSKASTGALSSSAGGSTAAPVTTITTVVPETSAAPASGGLRTITPGTYCAPEGGFGTYNGKRYLCAKSKASGEMYTDGRAHWRQG